MDKAVVACAKHLCNMLGHSVQTEQLGTVLALILQVSETLL